MSSSSCAADGLLQLSQRALAVLRSETPEHARHYAEVMRGLEVSLRVDDRSFLLRGWELNADASSSADITLSIGFGNLLALLDARLDLLDALRAERVFIRGECSALGRASQGMFIFLHAMARCTSGPSLLEALRELEAE